GSFEAYAQAKARLFSNSSLTHAIINIDDPYAQYMIQNIPKTCQLLTYGFKPGAAIRALKWQTALSGTKIEVSSPWGGFNLNIQSLGRFSIYNSLAVFASLLASGVNKDNVESIIGKLQPSPGRLEIVAERPTVLVDYAHTPD